jgi:hypothetical protein
MSRASSVRSRWPLALALLPFLLLIAREWTSQPDIQNGDFAQYLMHAEALADGRPYLDTGYIFSQRDRHFGPRAYPPGLPLVLAAVGLATGGSMLAAKGLMVFLSVGCLLVVGAYFWRHATPSLAIGTTVLVGLSPDFVGFSISPLSDVPFVGLVWLTILLADRTTSWSWARVIGVTGAAGAAILFRPHGLVLIPALLAWGVLNGRRLGWRPLIPGLALSFTALVGRLLVPDTAMRTWPPLRWLVGELLSPSPRYHLAVFENHLYPLPGNLPNDAYHVLSGALMLVGLIAFARVDPRRLWVVFAVIFALALASLRAAEIRYAWPLYPLFTFGLLNGVRVLVGQVARVRPERVALGVASILALVAVGKALATAPKSQRLDDPRLIELFEHLQVQAEVSPVRVAFIRPRVLAWKTGIPAMPLSIVRDPQEHLADWCEQGITHVVLGDMGLGPNRAQRTQEAIESYTGYFALGYRNAEFEVYRVLPEACSG